MVTSGRLRSWAQVRPEVAGRSARPAATERLGVTLPVVRRRLESGHAGLLLLVVSPGFVVDEAEAAAVGGEAAVGVVDAQVQAELGARGEHAVGLVGSLGDEVVDEDAGVALAAVHGEGRLAFEPERGVDAGHDALAGGFFVAAGPVDLPGEVEALHALDAEGAVELGGVDGVVLDGVAGAQHFGLFEAGDGVDDLPLHLHGQRGGHAVDVDLVGVEAFGLEEELVLGLVRELDDFVFDGGAVARADALDAAGVHGRAVDVFADEAERLRRGEGNVATDLGLDDLLCPEAEGSGIGVAGLLFERVPVGWCGRRGAAGCRS